MLTPARLIRFVCHLTLIGVMIGVHTVPALAQATPTPIEITRTPPPTNTDGSGDLLTGVWPRALAFDTLGNLWVANGFEGTVQRISEETGKPVEAPVKVGRQPTAMVWLDVTKTLWVASYDDANLTPVELDGTGKPVAREPIPLGDSRPVGLAISRGTLWIITQVENTASDKDNLIKFDPATKKELSRLTVGSFPTAIISSKTDSNPDDSLIFVANGHSDTVSVVDTKLESGKGKVTQTLSDGIPAFPFSLVFDGTYLWVGSYECKYSSEKCAESQVGRVRLGTGKSEPVGGVLPGRQVFTIFTLGHMWTANGHGEGIADFTVAANEGKRRIIPDVKSKGGRDSYYGIVLMTSRFVYVADWTNDRVHRFRAPGPVEVPPTPTPLPPTATFTPLPPCNPDPRFAPRLKPGDKGRVIDDTFDLVVRVRKEPNFTAATLTGKGFSVGEEFTVLEGPVSNNKLIDPKGENRDFSCFYRVEGLKDKEKVGFITEGGLENTDGKDKRYYLEPLR
jgi:YVTN family beta-propeller protein